MNMAEFPIRIDRLKTYYLYFKSLHDFNETGINISDKVYVVGAVSFRIKQFNSRDYSTKEHFVGYFKLNLF